MPGLPGDAPPRTDENGNPELPAMYERGELPVNLSGEFVDAEDGSTINALNPHDNSEIAQVAKAQVADIDRVVATAKRAFPAWRDMQAAERGRCRSSCPIWSRATRRSAFVPTRPDPGRCGNRTQVRRGAGPIPHGGVSDGSERLGLCQRLPAFLAAAQLPAGEISDQRPGPGHAFPPQRDFPL